MNARQRRKDKREMTRALKDFNAMLRTRGFVSELARSQQNLFGSIIVTNQESQ